MAFEIGKSVALIGAAIAVGWIGWVGHPLAFGLAVLFPALWASASNRTTAALASAGYFLAASRGLPVGVANFYRTDMWAGLLLWLVAASGFVLVHTVLWTRVADWRRQVRYLAVMLVMAVPPFGIVGWAHPITAAGALFPGWGWFGLAATALLLLGMTTKASRLCGVLAAAAWAASAIHYEPVRAPPGWTGIDTTVGGGSVVMQFVSAQAQTQLIETVQSKPASAIMVLPESAAGLWTPTVERLWTNRIKNRTVLVGASILRRHGYDNAVVAIREGQAEIVYRQRMPVPVSMWRPWSGSSSLQGGATASFFEQPVVDFAGSRIAILICYEQLLVWPLLQSIASHPEILVATGNGWWAKYTSIIPIQKATMQSWARLFGLPLVTSFNSGPLHSGPLARMPVRAAMLISIIFRLISGGDENPG